MRARVAQRGKRTAKTGGGGSVAPSGLYNILFGPFLGLTPSLFYTSSKRPRACPVEFHARIYTRRLPGLPAFPRVAPQAAFGGLR
ncbi:MAG TPA: hypothetical protein VMV69_16850, partial [Pirellulales bacterium]|nr:hypothetical protein [Pirellulales bacterium]